MCIFFYQFPLLFLFLNYYYWGGLCVSVAIREQLWNWFSTFTGSGGHQMVFVKQMPILNKPSHASTFWFFSFEKSTVTYQAMCGCGVKHRLPADTTTPVALTLYQVLMESVCWHRGKKVLWPVPCFTDDGTSAWTDSWAWGLSQPPSPPPTPPEFSYLPNPWSFVSITCSFWICFLTLGTETHARMNSSSVIPVSLISSY